jgi:hypothetical protein
MRVNGHGRRGNEAVPLSMQFVGLRKPPYRERHLAMAIVCHKA